MKTTRTELMNIRYIEMSGDVEIPTSAARVTAMKASINTRPMAIGDRAMEKYRACVITVHQLAGGYSGYIFLQHEDPKKSLLLRTTPEVVPITHYDQLERAAQDMLEGHGFILERMEIKTESLKGEWNRLLPFKFEKSTADHIAQFDTNDKTDAEAIRPDEIITVLGRLLATF